MNFYVILIRVVIKAVDLWLSNFDILLSAFGWSSASRVHGMLGCIFPLLLGVLSHSHHLVKVLFNTASILNTFNIDNHFSCQIDLFVFPVTSAIDEKVSDHSKDDSEGSKSNPKYYYFE